MKQTRRGPRPATAQFSGAPLRATGGPLVDRRGGAAIRALGRGSKHDDDHVDDRIPPDKG